MAYGRSAVGIRLNPRLFDALPSSICGTQPIATPSRRRSVVVMEANKHSPDRQGNSARQEVFFRDLGRRNERRARLARKGLDAGAEREPRPELDRAGKSQRQRRSRRDP
jgi:hypothetical protein